MQRFRVCGKADADAGCVWFRSEERPELLAKLEQAGIPYEIDGGDIILAVDFAADTLEALGYVIE
jgi:hypothetical protein